MLKLTRLNGETSSLIPNLLLSEKPDTVITLTTSKKFVVRESVARITEQMIKHKKQVFSNLKK